MANVHLFNPENDLALAANIANYTPPDAAWRLAQAGAVLPLWYGADGDMALCYGVPARWYDRITQAYGINVGLYPHSLDGLEAKAAPWGWSLASRKTFIDDGFPLSALPTDCQLATLRNLSHRRTSILLTDALIACGIPGIPLPAIEVESPAILESLLGKEPKVLKMPWSCSGRGVTDSRVVGKERAMIFGLNSIRRQGSVMVEYAFDRAFDFAMLFECRGGKCKSIGTSVFVADERGVYIGNLLADEAERRRRVGEWVDLNYLDLVTDAIAKSIQEAIAPHYDGPLGVDMLVDREGVLVPCVELNLRRTMGHVANATADRYITPGRTGIFKVQPDAVTSLPSPVIEDHRLAGGAQLLIPENPHFSIYAQILP